MRPVVLICFVMANPMGQNKNFFRVRGIVVLISFSIGESNGSKSNSGGMENKLNDPTSLVLDQLYLGVTANVN